ncbi:MAG: hypothetical protein QNK89_02430 [Lacinutrix sp.]|uniref:hypothetical protein n=1 Tax=Lacinutrix sp. TaxID=1937692 RepID=UPI00309D5752
MSFFVAFKFFFYYNFGVRPTASVIFIIFETNATEASEFLTNYFDFNSIVIFILTFIAFASLVLILFTKSSFFSFLKLKKLSLLFKICIISLILFSCYLLKRSFSEQSIILTLSKSIEEYNIAKDYYKANLAKPYNTSIKINAKTEKPQVGIVIIGESTSRWHMGLYG